MKQEIDFRDNELKQTIVEISRTSMIDPKLKSGQYNLCCMYDIQQLFSHARLSSLKNVPKIPEIPTRSTYNDIDPLRVEAVSDFL